MKVKAIADGYFNRELRKEGDVFDVPDGETASWFVAVDVPPETSDDEGDHDQDQPGKKGKKKPSPEEQPPA